MKTLAHPGSEIEPGHFDWNSPGRRHDPVHLARIISLWVESKIGRDDLPGITRQMSGTSVPAPVRFGYEGLPYPGAPLDNYVVDATTLVYRATASIFDKEWTTAQGPTPMVIVFPDGGTMPDWKPWQRQLLWPRDIRRSAAP